MTVVLINPNSTESMTLSALVAARGAAPDVMFEGWTSHDGPPVIQGEADGRACVPPLLRLVEKADREGADLIVIACFDDTGLAEARALASCPVIGIGQAAFTAAALLTDRFAVVTTLPVSVPVIEANLARHGHSAPVLACGVPVAALDADPDAARPAVLEAAFSAVDGGAEAIVLGCAGMAPLTGPIARGIRRPVLDGVTSAARLSPALLSGAVRGKRHDPAARSDEHVPAGSVS